MSLFKNEGLIHFKRSLSFFNNFSAKTQRKAVSEVIATTILVGITVAGAIMISVALQNTLGNVGMGFNSGSLQNQLPPQIKLTGYDTRDGTSLFGISGFNNKPDSKLCTNTCAGSDNLKPVSGGTEFIVLRIKNEGIEPYSINNILINDIEHLWDEQISGPLSFSPPEKFPRDGKFSIVLAADATKTLRSSNAISSGEEVLIIIKLNDKLYPSTAPADINLNIPLLVEFTGSLSAPSFVVLSGDTV